MSLNGSLMISSAIVALTKSFFKRSIALRPNYLGHDSPLPQY
jgi:hypothetical protein